MDERERLAGHLAERLNDTKSLRFYRLVCSTLDATAIRDALVRALDVDPSVVRRSRAALFTSIVRPLIATKLRLRSAA